MENLQGNLAALLTISIAADCESITFTDGNTYSGALADEAKKLFFVRKHSDGDVPMFESLDADHQDVFFTIDNYEYKDGWDYAFLLAVPKTIGEGSLAATYRKGDLIFYENDTNTFSGFYIARVDMGGVGESVVVSPEDMEENEWTIPTFEQYWGYKKNIDEDLPCATDFEYGYWEEFIICLSDLQRNEMLGHIECSANCKPDCSSSELGYIFILIEGARVDKTNKNYKAGQLKIEEVENIYENTVLK